MHGQSLAALLQDSKRKSAQAATTNHTNRQPPFPDAVAPRVHNCRKARLSRALPLCSTNINTAHPPLCSLSIGPQLCRRLLSEFQPGDRPNAAVVMVLPFFVCLMRRTNSEKCLIVTEAGCSLAAPPAVSRVGVVPANPPVG
jgi:hypothetical protein